MAEWTAMPMVYDNGPAGDDDWMIAEKDGGGIAWGLEKADALHIIGLHNAALSHAAGQEAVFWITQDDVNRAKYQGDNVIACPAVGDAPEGAVMLYPTPAQPPASAEVGMDD